MGGNMSSSRRADTRAIRPVATIWSRMPFPDKKNTPMNRIVLILAALMPLAALADGTTELGEVTVTDTRAAVPLGMLADNTTRLDSDALTLLSENHPAQVFS